MDLVGGVLGGGGGVRVMVGGIGFGECGMMA